MKFSYLIRHNIPFCNETFVDDSVYTYESDFCVLNLYENLEDRVYFISAMLWAYNTALNRFEMVNKCSYSKFYRDQKDQYLRIKGCLKTEEVEKFTTHYFFFHFGFYVEGKAYTVYSPFYKINRTNLQIEFEVLQNTDDVFIQTFINNSFVLNDKKKVKNLLVRLKKLNIENNNTSLKFSNDSHIKFINLLMSYLSDVTKKKCYDHNYFSFKTLIEKNYNISTIDDFKLCILEIRRIIYLVEPSITLFIESKNITYKIPYCIRISSKNIIFQRLDCFLFLEYNNIYRDKTLEVNCEEYGTLFCFIGKEEINLNKLTSLRLVGILDGKVIIEEYLNYSSYEKKLFL